MFLLLRAAFWRQWAVAVVLGTMAIAAFSAIDRAHAQTMRASFYGAESGRVTASGALFHPLGLSAANWTLPFGTRLSVCFRRCATVTVNDRGPAHRLHRDLDLSYGAARVIGLVHAGVAAVQVELLGRGSTHDRRARRRRHHH